MVNSHCFFHFVFFSHSTMSSTATRLLPTQRPEAKKCLIKYVTLLISILITASGVLLESFYLKDPEPYHTSALLEEELLMELLTGHTECIYCELRIHAHVFRELISELCCNGCENS